MRIKTAVLVVLLMLISSSGVLILSGLTAPSPTELGTGVLWAYKDSDRTNEVPKNGQENYQVLPSEKYYFNLTGITEFDLTGIIVVANYSDSGTIHTVKIVDQWVAEKPSNITFEWAIPNLPLMTPINFMYGPKADLDLNGNVTVVEAATVSAWWYPGPPVGPSAKEGGYNSTVDINNDGEINLLDAAAVSAYWSGPAQGPKAHSWCEAKNALSPNPRLLLVVPEVFLGPIGVLVALFSGVGIKKYIRRKKN